MIFNTKEYQNHNSILNFPAQCSYEVALDSCIASTKINQQFMIHEKCVGCFEK